MGYDLAFFIFLINVQSDPPSGDQATEVLVQYLGAEFKQKYKEDFTKNKRGKVKLATGAKMDQHVLLGHCSLFCREFV